MRRARTLTVAVLLSGLTALGCTGQALADDEPVGQTTSNPGVISDDVIQIPIGVPVNLCGDTSDVVGLLNPASNNACSDG